MELGGIIYFAESPPFFQFQSLIASFFGDLIFIESLFLSCHNLRLSEHKKTLLYMFSQGWQAVYFRGLIFDILLFQSHFFDQIQMIFLFLDNCRSKFL
jgi:hypothetical protein